MKIDKGFILKFIPSIVLAVSCTLLFSDIKALIGEDYPCVDTPEFTGIFVYVCINIVCTLFYIVLALHKEVTNGAE